MALVPDEDIGGFNELRMMIAIGQQPDVWMVSDSKPPHVGKCVNVDADIENGALVISADFEAPYEFLALGAEVALPSGWGFSFEFPQPQLVRAGQWIKVNGTVSMEIT